MRRVVNRFARLARGADLNVLPSDGRIADFCRRTGVPAARCVRVWNCPLQAEIRPPRSIPAGSGLTVLFHGAVVPARVPVTLLDALTRLPEEVRLRVVGYESTGARGYLTKLRREADRRHLGDRVELRGPVSHAGLFDAIEDCDVGLAWFAPGAGDVNIATMAGASNKAFEYLACGLPLLVADRPDWRTMFVEPGYAHVCDLTDVESIAAAIRTHLENRTAMRAMGERGRQQVLAEWNYDTQFAPVLRAIAGLA